METFFNVSSQTVIFLWSAVLGGIMGIVFDFFRVIRALKKHNAVSVFIEDMFFVMIYFLVMFIYTMEKSRGEMRFFVYVGSLLGFTIYLLTVGNLIVNLLRKIIRFVKSICHKVYVKTLFPLKKFFVHIFQKYVIETVKDTINDKKILYRRKKHLKQSSKIVYNNHKHIRTTPLKGDVISERKIRKNQKEKKITCNQIS